MKNDSLSFGGFLSGLSCGLWFGIDCVEKLLAVILIALAAVILVMVGLGSKKAARAHQAESFEQASRQNA